MADRSACLRCATQLAFGALACPRCGTLVHADALREIAARAQAHESAGDARSAMIEWRSAMELLPRDSAQYASIAARVDDLGRRGVAARPAGIAPAAADPSTPALPPVPRARETAAPTTPKRKGVSGAILGGLGVAAMLLWKAKALLIAGLKYAKVAVLGLTKSTTLFSMLGSIWVYWLLWGWQFAVGLVVSIYLHEMGHVAALTRYGIKATAPMFIPGFGAMIRMRQYPASPREEAVVGLAGPLAGLATAAGALAVAQITGWGAWGAIAQVGAWINLFNLIPVMQLDGAHGFAALNRWQRATVCAAFAGAFYLHRDGLLILLLIAGVGVTIFRKPAEKGDLSVLAWFVALIAALVAVVMVPVAVPKASS